MWRWFRPFHLMRKYTRTQIFQGVLAQGWWTCFPQVFPITSSCPILLRWLHRTQCAGWPQNLLTTSAPKSWALLRAHSNLQHAPWMGGMRIHLSMQHQSWARSPSAPSPTTSRDCKSSLNLLLLATHP